MSRLYRWATAAACLLLSGCGSTELPSEAPPSLTPPSGASSVFAAPPVLAPSGPSDLFGLQLPLRPSEWQMLESTQDHLALQYKLALSNCQTGECPMLLVSTSRSEFYNLNVKGDELRDVGDECTQGKSAFQPAQLQGMMLIAGRPAKYYINPWCSTFTQGGKVPRIRRNWLFAPEGLLLQEVQGFDGGGITDLDKILAAAQWRG